MLVLLLLPVIAKHLHFFSEVEAPGKDGTAIPITSKWLGREKGSASDIGKGSRRFLEMGGTKALGGIFDHGNSPDLANIIDPGHIRTLPIKKGWENQYSSQILEKAGVDYTVSAADIDQEVASFIEKEVMLELRAATLFREIPVNAFATVLPLQPDAGLAEWKKADTAGNLQNRDNPTADTYTPGQVILNAERLISTTFMDNEVDEQVLINLMPMLVESVARAHARAVEQAILTGNGSTISGLAGHATALGTTLSIGSADKLTADILLAARQNMGKYGMDPRSVSYVVSQQGYYDLLNDTKFQTLDEVGSDLAVRITGMLGAVYGTPVVPSDEFAAPTAGGPAAFAVNTRNYVIPRLRGVRVEQDYQVVEQRRAIVASQNLGFTELFAGGANQRPSVRINYAA